MYNLERLSALHLVWLAARHDRRRSTLYAVYPRGGLRPAVAECLTALREAAASAR